MKESLVKQMISDLTGRKQSFFHNDLQTNHQKLNDRIEGKSALVIGGAGTIGSNYIKALLKFPLRKLVVVDLNENGLAELVRDIRSSADLNVPEIVTYPISFGGVIFERFLEEHPPFDIVANFAALKHVRSAKDPYAIQAMFENNFLLANRLLMLLLKHKPKHFFCVSTDKATNPVSIMGATKKLMEDVVFAYHREIKVSTARFANVAFSNGSLLESFMKRYEKKQPIVCPTDIKRFFVSPEEAGQLCLMACLLGESTDIFIPKFGADEIIPFSRTLDAFLSNLDLKALPCDSEQEAREKATLYNYGDPEYPVFYFETDTSGEKPYEEFFAERDVVDNNTFSSLGVIKNAASGLNNADDIVREGESLFASTPTIKEIATFLQKHIPEFSYINRNKTLDQKM